jgi:hypothetical protein
LCINREGRIGRSDLRARKIRSKTRPLFAALEPFHRGNLLSPRHISDKITPAPSIGARSRPIHTPMNKTLRLAVTTVFILVCAMAAAAQENRLLSYLALDEYANDLVYSPSRNLIYASVPSTGGTFGNYVIAIDPVAKHVVRSTFSGSEPNKLALSDDERYLYVGLDGSGSIQRIPLDQFVPDLTFSLGLTQSNGPMYVEDITVAPSQPNVIAVSRKNRCCSPRHEGVAIYENGVMRPAVTNKFNATTELEFADDASTLLGYDAEISDYSYRRLLVDNNGVSILSSVSTSFAGSIEIRYAGGRVYSSNGQVIDAVSALPVATFAVGTFQNGLAIDTRNRRAIYVQGNTIKAFDIDNFRPVGNIPIPDTVASRARLVRWGRRGLAFRLPDNRIVLAEAAFVTRKLER